MNKLKEALKSVEHHEELSIKPSYVVKQFITKKKKYIETLLVEEGSIEKFQKSAIRAFNYKKSLENCEIESFVGAMITCDNLGLEANSYLGEAYILPSNIEGENKVCVHIGYKGMLNLAYRSGVLKSIYAHEVRENDEFDIDYGLTQKLTHKPLLKGNRGEIIGYYAVFNLHSGESNFIFMSQEEILSHGKKYSPNFVGGPWESEFDAMAKKTVIKKLLKYVPFSKEVNKAISLDGNITKEIN